MTAFRGETPIVQVLTPAQRALEHRAKETLEGRTIENVALFSDQLVVTLDNGANFTFTCEGGFVEIN